MASSHWLNRIAAPDSATAADESQRKMRWKILREGTPIEHFDALADAQKSWSVGQTAGSVDSGAVKYLLHSTTERDDCEMVVLYPKGNRATVCISSQIGCGVGCTFCATGTMGFRRNLSSEEMLEQVYLARCVASQQGRRLRNVVFMGMGEPLHNMANVIPTLQFLTSESGFFISPRYIMVSTSGNPMALRELAQRFPKVRIAFSLHAAHASLRRQIMPRVANDFTSLRETLEFVNAVQHPDPIWIEYILIAGVNDEPEHLDALASFCDGLRVEVNLIPYNPVVATGQDATGLSAGDLPVTPNDWVAPSLESQRAFAQTLRGLGVPTKVRQSFGQSDKAACGQLVTTLQNRSQIAD